MTEFGTVGMNSSRNDGLWDPWRQRFPEYLPDSTATVFNQNRISKKEGGFEVGICGGDQLHYHFSHLLHRF